MQTSARYLCSWQTSSNLYLSENVPDAAQPELGLPSLLILSLRLGLRASSSLIDHVQARENPWHYNIVDQLWYLVIWQCYLARRILSLTKIYSRVQCSVTYACCHDHNR